MKLIKPSYEILTPLTWQDAVRIYENIERAGRLSWKSEDKISIVSYNTFIPMIMSKNHESVLEHESLSVKFIVDRGVSHELVRHRIASFTQESTRYCNYSKDKFDGHITFIIPPWVEIEDKTIITIPSEITRLKEANVPASHWAASLLTAEMSYLGCISTGWTPQMARAVLPNSLKTEIIVTANIREWRHILTLRTSPAAHPQMSEVTIPLLKELQNRLPLLFGDIKCG